MGTTSDRRTAPPMSELQVKAGSLTVGFRPDGRVGEVLLLTRQQPLSGPGGFSVEEVVRPNGLVRDLGRAAGELSTQGDELRFKGTVPDAALDLSATFKGGAYIDVAGQISDHSGQDRAVRVSFTLPVKLAGWRWHNTAACGRKMEDGRSYPNRPGELHYLGKRGESFSNEDHEPCDIAINKLPFCAVSMDDLGLALAYPLHEPRVFLMRASTNGLSITFSLGLTPATEKFPGKAGFRFVIHPVDPGWGIRSAAERYYQFFPELFETKAVRHGNFSGFPKASRGPLPDNPEDFGLVYLEDDFQWTNGELTEEDAARAKGLGATVFHWREPWSWFHKCGQELSADDELHLLKTQAAGEVPGGHGEPAGNQYCGAPPEEGARAALASYVVNHQGKLERNIYTYEAWSLPMNLDPELPEPNRASLATEWQFRWMDRWSDPQYRGPRNYAWDSLDDWSGFRRLNFRREHFRHSSLPLTFDPASGEVCQVVGFHDWSFARHHATMIRDRGGLVMSNINLEHSMMYCGRWVDVHVRERHVVDYDEERLSVMRMLVCGKPVSFLGSWQPKDSQGLEAVLRKLLIFGMCPGSARAEHERELYKKYIPVISRVAQAGWQPVTHARAEGLWLERFGAEPGALFFTAGNRGPRRLRGRVVIDADALGRANRLGELRVEEVLEGRPLKVDCSEHKLIVEVDFEPGETLVLVVRVEQIVPGPAGESPAASRITGGNQ